MLTTAPVDFFRIRDHALDLVRQSRGSIRNAFRVRDYIREIMDRTIAEYEGDVISKLDGRFD